MDDFWYFLDLRWFSVIFISLQIVLTACIIYMVLVLQHERKMDTEILLDELRKIVRRLTANIDCKFSMDTEEVSRYEKYSFSNLGFEDETKLKSLFEDCDLEIDYSCLNENIHVDVSLPNITKESSSKQPEEKKNELSPINKQDGFTPEKFQNDSWCSEGMENWKGFSFKLEKVQTLSDNVKRSTADTLVDLKNEPDYEKNRKVFSKPCQLFDGAEYDSFAEVSTEFESHCTFDSSMQNDVNDSRLISNKVNPFNHDYADDKIEMTVNDIVSAFIETRKHADSERDPIRNVDDTEYKTAHSSEKTISFKYEDYVKKVKRKRKKRSRLLRIRREKRRRKCLRDIITWQSTLRRNSFKVIFEIRPGTTSGRTAFQDIAQGDSNYDSKHNTVKENKKDKFVQQTDELDRNNDLSELPSIHNTQASNDSSLTSFETLRSFFNRASMPSKQKEEVFGYEWLRLGTFSDWPRTSIFCTSLARNGWVSLWKGDRAQCFSCHAVHEGWKISDDPNNYHMQNCRFQSDQSNNVPIPRGTSVHTSNSKQTSKQYNQTVSLPENSAEENQALEQIAIHKPGEFGIRDEKNKMEGRRSKTNAQINDLRIGFIRTKTRGENSKHATDASPKEEEEQEQEQEEPIVATPRQQLSAETSSSELVTTSIRRKTDTRRYSETPTPRVSLGDHHHSKTTGIPSPHRKGAQLERMSFDGPKFPSYAQLAERISSYTNWPPDMTQTPQELASAGFFYAGHDSYIRCFFCGGSLGKWEVRHDPWVEHASWFKHCPFVRQSRGQEFVDLVQKNADLRNREKIGNHQTNTLKGNASICEESEEEVHRHQQLLQNGKQLSQNNHIDVLKRQTILETQQTALVPKNCTLNSTCLHLEDKVDGDEGASEVRSLQSSRFTTPISTEDPENIFILSEENTEAFCYEVIRHNTFFKKPFTSKLSVILAKNGWVAFGKGDKTRCHSCHVVHEGWRPCDDPGRYHISGCSFRNCHTNNISLSCDHSIDIQTHPPLNDSPLSEEKYEMFQVAVINSNQSDTSNPQLEPTKRDPMRLSLKFDGPKHPSYATLAKRISSYNDWPAAKTQKPQEMAEAGFFYQGNDDCTQCFFCGGGLKSWGAGEDPWFEHARWFNDCAFLRQNCGQEFINLVQKRVAELEKEERLVTTMKEMGYSETKIKSAINIIKTRLPRGNASICEESEEEVHRHQQLLQNGKQLSQNNHTDVLKRQTIQETQQTAMVPRNCTLNSTCLHLEDKVDGDEGASEVRSLQSSRFTTLISTEDPENIFILSEENTEAFCYEVIRHNTFFKKPFTSKLSAILAKNGWVALGKGDKTRCHSCHIVHEGWRPCDDPGRYHISSCSFRNCHTNNISLSCDHSIDIQTHPTLNDSPLSEEKYEMFQVAVINSNQSDTSNPQLEPPKRDPMRLSLNFDCPKHPCYATLAKRISSYNDWPAAKTQTPQEMADAGFFYEGNDDCTRCFFCGGGLRSWGAEEDPWFEHARWFKECAFLRQNRGQEFIDLVQKRVAELEKEERLVTTMKEMGYSETKIKSAINIIKTRLPRGNRIVSAQDIMEVIFESHSSTTVSENFISDTDQLDCAVASRSYHMRQSEPPPFQHEAVCATETLTIDQTSREEKFSRHSIENPIFDDLNSLIQENMDLKNQFLCNICTDEMVSIVFLPCGHLACCKDCAPAMNKCPICRKFVTRTINAFLM